MKPRDPDRGLTLAIAATSLALTAHHVAAKAARDALFLSTFHVQSLPAVLVASALLTVAIVLAASRAMSHLGPGRVLGPAYLASAFFHLLEWALVLSGNTAAARAAALLLYAHVAAFLPVLISGFWSILNELPDPRRVGRLVERAATAMAMGGVVGGLLAMMLPIAALLPALAVVHAGCFFVMSRLAATALAEPDRVAERDAVSVDSWVKVLRSSAYLRTVAVLAVTLATAAVLLQYAFSVSAQAVAQDEPHLRRIFSVFYTAVSFSAFLVQRFLSRRLLKGFGLVETISVLPAGVVATGMVALILPGIAAVAASHGVEQILRGSLYRSGYEGLYKPVPRKEKRPAKAIVDVGAERLGDALGALIALGLGKAAISMRPVLIAAAAAAGVLGLAVASRLRGRYVSHLKANLLQGGIVIDPAEVRDRTTQRVMVAQANDPVNRQLFRGRDFTPDEIDALCSGVPERIRTVITAHPVLPRTLIPFVIPLLEDDALAPDVTTVLARSANRDIGQLTDSLLDASLPIALRRRIPRILATASPDRAVEALFRGLKDPRFEIRLRSGRALARLAGPPASVRLDADQVLEIVGREIAVERSVWEMAGALEAPEKWLETQFVVGRIRNRASRSLEHVFDLLALAFPEEPLRVSFLALHSGDPRQRGIALEYLEIILPRPMRDRLWPFLEADPSRPARPRRIDEVVRDLADLHPSLEFRMDEDGRLVHPKDVGR